MHSTRTISIRGPALALAVAALPLVRGTTLHEAPGVSFGIFRLTTLHYFDLVLIGVVLVTLVEWRELRWPRSSVGVLAAAIPIALAVSTLLTPSPRGLSMVLRWVAGAVLIASMGSLTRSQLRRYVALPMLAMATAQGVLTWVQLATDSDAGLDWLGGAAPRLVNGVARAAGTFAVPYLLAAYALVALGIGIALRPRPASRWWLVLLAGATVPVALTFSRAALLGLVAGGAVVVAAARSDRSMRPVAIAILVGLLVPAALNASSWWSRVDDSSGSSTQTAVRTELVEQAVELAGENRLFGVGAARYSLALEERYTLDERTAHPVHVAPLLFVVEVGLILGLAVAAIGLRVLIDLVRHSPATRVLLTTPMGFVLFDHLNVTHPIGPVLTMVWLGVLASLVGDGPISTAPSTHRWRRRSPRSLRSS